MNCHLILIVKECQRSTAGIIRNILSLLRVHTATRLSNAQVNGQVREMTDDDRLRSKKANADYASRGLRSMALAYRVIDRDVDINKMPIDEAENHLVFVGLTTMSDPPRPEIYDAVKRCHQAKIRIIMVTGDSKLTAKSVAVQIGLTSDKARVISGNELEKMNDDELRKALKGEVIFCQSST